MERLEQQISSAKQLSDMANSLLRIQSAEREEKAFHKKGIEAQIESTKTLKDQREEHFFIRVTLDAILKQGFEQTKQQEEQKKIDTARYHENLRFSRIAAWTGVIGTILAITSIALQFIIP